MAFLKKQPRKFIFTAFSVDGNRDRIDRNLDPVLQWAGARGSSPSAGMAELADALDLGSSAARRGGSSPLVRTRNEQARPRAASLICILGPGVLDWRYRRR